MTNAAVLDLGALGLDRGAHLLIERALRGLPVGGRLRVTGNDPALAVHLRGWARAKGHGFELGDEGPVLLRTGLREGRWRGAEQAGQPGLSGVVERPPSRWGLAARGATVEAGSPAFRFALDDRNIVWAEEAASLYAQAVAAQWDPNTAIDWEVPFELPDEVEDAIVQVMTYLIENETAALVVPARFLAQLHPHFREVMQLLAVQTADEARHIEVFTRRALLKRDALGLSTVGGQLSLKTLVDEPDFSTAALLLSVMGEGSFLSLLWFLHEHAPDPVTRQIAKLAAQDEARHVAFGLAHLRHHLDQDGTCRTRLANAIVRRHDELAHTAGLNEEVFDALVLLGAGCWEHDALERGWDAVVQLTQDMDTGRTRRLQRLGFSAEEAADLSKLHTRNFM